MITNNNITQNFLGSLEPFRPFTRMMIYADKYRWFLYGLLSLALLFRQGRALSSCSRPSRRRLHCADPSKRSRPTSRRETLQNVATAAMLGFGATVIASDSSWAASSSDVTVAVEKAGERLGLELYDVMIGTPSRPVVAIKSIVASNSKNRYLQPGLVLRDFSSATQVQERLANGPFPVRLVFRNLAAEGDAISDLGTPIVTAQDALNLARRTTTSTAEATGDQTVVDRASPSSTYQVSVLEQTTCRIESRRVDVLEIIYEAHVGGPEGPIYDSSLQRGTGQPYQMVLGSGDMLPGVDQGLYNMCPGEVRGLDIPPQLAYGSRGNKLFRIPPNASLYWKVELVSVNSVIKGDNSRSRDDMEQRAPY